MKTNTLEFATLGTILTLALAACGGGTTTTENPPPTDFVANLVDAMCTRAVRCNSYPDKAACSAIMANISPPLDAAIKAGRITIDESQVSACLDGFSSMSCNYSALPDLFGGPSAACQAAIQGHVPAGGACLVNGECSGGNRCRTDDSSSLACKLGVCQPRGGLGAACSSDFDDCESLYSCDLSSSIPGTCKTRIAQGQACQRPLSCAAGLTCVGTAAVCSPYPQDGQTCSQGSIPECDSLESYCDPTESKCKPRIAVGQACIALSSYPFSSCVTYANCVNGLCQALPKLGDACSVADGGNLYVCLGAIPCVAGVCTLSPVDLSCINGSADAGTGRPTDSPPHIMR